MEQFFCSDEEVFEAVLGDVERQEGCLNLIASENYASEAVLAALANPINNKYAEGYPGRRYYGGCEFVDVIERLAIERVKELFGAEYANVQPHAGVQANMAVYFATLELGDTILAPKLSHGGHLSHGSPVSFSGKLYNVVRYGVRQDTETVDFDQVATLARENKPKLIICGYSAYPRTIDFARFHEIADEVSAHLIADIAHISGLVAAGVHPSPVPHAHFVTSTTHKTLRGPRGAFILCREEFSKEIDRGVFPITQGGPFEHCIAAKAVCFKEAAGEAFRQDQVQTVANSSALAEELIRHGFRLVAGGSDNHLILVDVGKRDISGRDAEDWLRRASIIVNRNAIPFDERPPMEASGIRIGTPCLTTRGMKEDEMRVVGRLLACVLNDPSEKSVGRARAEVSDLCSLFPIYHERLEAMRAFQLGTTGLS